MSITTPVRPVSIEQTLEHSSSTLSSVALLPSHTHTHTHTHNPSTTTTEDALHCFDYLFLRSLRSLFQYVSFPNYMSRSFLTYFTAMAHAAPVVARQCTTIGCRDATTVSWAAVSTRVVV